MWRIRCLYFFHKSGNNFPISGAIECWSSENKGMISHIHVWYKTASNIYYVPIAKVKANRTIWSSLSKRCRYSLPALQTIEIGCTQTTLWSDICTNYTCYMQANSLDLLTQFYAQGDIRNTHNYVIHWTSSWCPYVFTSRWVLARLINSETSGCASFLASQSKRRPSSATLSSTVCVWHQIPLQLIHKSARTLNGWEWFWFTVGV